MKIETTNDGKQRAQSCDATLTLKDKNEWGSFTAEFTGYGANEWSAKENLIENIDKLIAELDKIKSENT